MAAPCLLEVLDDLGIHRALFISRSVLDPVGQVCREAYLGPHDFVHAALRSDTLSLYDMSP